MMKRVGSPKSNDSSVVMSEEEQNKIIDDLKLEAQNQTKTIRYAFHIVFLVVALILFVCFFYTMYSPWEFEHQKHFKGLFKLEIFQVFYLCSGYCFFISAYLVQVERSD